VSVNLVALWTKRRRLRLQRPRAKPHPCCQAANWHWWWALVWL